MENLLNIKMTRKEFIYSLGLLFVSITGITRIINSFAKNNLINISEKKVKGFGTGPYGV